VSAVIGRHRLKEVHLEHFVIPRAKEILRNHFPDELQDRRAEPYAGVVDHAIQGHPPRPPLSGLFFTSECLTCKLTGGVIVVSGQASLDARRCVMAEFRRPKQYQAAGPDYFSFLERELKTPNYLKERSNLVVASYILPLLAKQSNIENFKVSNPSEKSILQQYTALAGADLPVALSSWYGNA
jgi:hypothetical protein